MTTTVFQADSEQPDSPLPWVMGVLQQAKNTLLSQMSFARELHEENQRLRKALHEQQTHHALRHRAA